MFLSKIYSFSHFEQCRFIKFHLAKFDKNMQVK